MCIQRIKQWFYYHESKLHEKSKPSCHHSSFYNPSFHNSIIILTYSLYLSPLILFTTHTYGKGQDNKMCIGTWQTTGNSTLVRLGSRVGIPSHLLPVLLLDMLHIDHLGVTIQPLSKVICRNPIHVGVLLWTNQWGQGGLETSDYMLGTFRAHVHLSHNVTGG